MAAVQMAKANDLRVSIRGGGHNAAGLGVCNDGLVIDLAPISYRHGSYRAARSGNWPGRSLGTKVRLWAGSDPADRNASEA